MNIFDIGVDIIEIDRIRKAVDKNNRFLEKIFTDREIEYLISHSKDYAIANAITIIKD
ncbi:4'-phosphopantetheinyl transferase superfamily protein [Clostridioides difficile]|uniref:4'-phosphopantetheinyl transferase superfamily protein n=1 Tax=Clostridioides difficile TaxID=1496 RepID=UPI0028A9B699|nr:4'-phosphopantetheinyl transferase superfamily protein [Clostridioides difficile]